MTEYEQGAEHMARAYEAWWLPVHVIYRYVAIDQTGHKTWHPTLERAEQQSREG
jgi:hypothetical protein